MSIEVDRDREWKPMMEKIMDILNNILQYQENFDNEIFSDLSRLEDKIDLIKSNTELQIKASGKKKVS